MKDTLHQYESTLARPAGVPHDTVDTRDPKAVENEVQSICAALFPDGGHAVVPRAFAWMAECFNGSLEDYLPVDARYHDFEHTMQGTLCLARLLQGRHVAGVLPRLTLRQFEITLLAILFHDSGYLKRREDTKGTGAKYTVIHVDRSAAFVAEYLPRKGFADAEIAAMQHMILCTGIDVDLNAIPFRNDMERTTGFALATADLLGQMAARDYVDKLPLLYDEFAECARFVGASLPPTFAFDSAENLMRCTPAFWDNYVLPKVNDDFRGLYHFLNDPYPDGPNAYVQRIEENVARVRQLACR
jgi:hypothetical protein